MSTTRFSTCEHCGWAITNEPDEFDGGAWYHWNRPHAGNNRFCEYLDRATNHVTEGWGRRADKGPQAVPGNGDPIFSVQNHSAEDLQKIAHSLNTRTRSAKEPVPDYRLSDAVRDSDIEDELTQEDPVNHPRHYTSHPSGVECKDIIKHYPVPIAFAIKYLWRAGIKNSDLEIQDLEKAVFWINEHIEDLKHGPKQYELDLGVEES